MWTKGYTVLGWLTWQGVKTVVNRKFGQNKMKLGAAATVFGVIAAGILAARASSDSG